MESLLDIGRQLVPKNIVMAAAQSGYLGVIFFAIVLAIILTGMGPPAEPLIQIIEISNEAIMRMVRTTFHGLPCNLNVSLGTLLDDPKYPHSGHALMPTIILPINLIWHGSPHRATDLAPWIPVSAMVRLVS